MNCSMRQRKQLYLALAVIVPTTVAAIGRSDVRLIIEQSHPGARITEIERETYRGRDVWEVDFRHEGQKLEAIIGLDGETLKVQIDD